MSWRLIIIPLLVVNLFCSCTGHYTRPVVTKGVYYRVKSGDTLWSIANAYKIDVQDLAEANNITDPKLIVADSVLFIPDADQIIDDVMSAVSRMESAKKAARKEVSVSESKTRKTDKQGDRGAARLEMGAKGDAGGEQEAAAAIEDARPITAKGRQEAPASAGRIAKEDMGPKAEEKVKEGDGTAESKIKFDRDRFIWPVKGKVRSKFGFQRDGTYYNWVTIAGREGSPVLAAAGGTVIFSSSLKDYGETIIIKHQDSYATVYTNLRNRIVQVDDRVKKGSRIAFLGKTDKKTEPSLNFEIRHKNKARNPLFFLP
ncbi:MAG TPA: M23 family metallopeptidase [Syntrophales bacterium]|nr:M23 family metallopeptidase [Syntrophales bacterium]